MKQLIGLLTFLVLVPLEVEAQQLRGSINVTESSITYTLPHRSATVSRDILANLPRQGEYQHTADDLALIFDYRERRGNPVPVPPMVSDSLIAELQTAVNQALAREASLAELNDALEAENQMLLARAEEAEATIATRDVTLAENQRTITTLQGTITSLEQQLADASQDAELAAEYRALFTAVEAMIERLRTGP